MLKIDFDKLKHSHKYDSIGFKKTGHKVKRTLYCKTNYIETLNKNIEFKY